MNEKRSFPAAAGAPSLLVIFSALCLVIFSLISLSTARAGEKLSVLSEQSAVAYYKADAQAEETLAMIRNGILPEGVNENNGIYSYTCDISDVLGLSVEVFVSESGDYEILKWQSIRTQAWEADDDIDVWDGES